MIFLWGVLLGWARLGSSYTANAGLEYLEMLSRGTLALLFTTLALVHGPALISFSLASSLEGRALLPPAPAPPPPAGAFSSEKMAKPAWELLVLRGCFAPTCIT